MRRCLVHHPRRYAGARPVRLRNDDELDAAIGESPDYQYGLAAPGMGRIVDPPLDRVFVGSLSLFRALQGRLSTCLAKQWSTAFPARRTIVAHQHILDARDERSLGMRGAEQHEGLERQDNAIGLVA